MKNGRETFNRSTAAGFMFYILKKKKARRQFYQKSLQVRLKKRKHRSRANPIFIRLSSTFTWNNESQVQCVCSVCVKGHLWQNAGCCAPKGSEQDEEEKIQKGNLKVS